MNSSLASSLTARPTRLAAVVLSVSALVLGGFFISKVQAQVVTTPFNLVVTQPDGVHFWRGSQTISWTASTTATTMKMGYTSSPGSWQNDIDTPITITTGSHAWNTNVANDGTYYILLQAIQTADQAQSVAFKIDNHAPVTTLSTTTSPSSTWLV